MRKIHPLSALSVYIQIRKDSEAAIGNKAGARGIWKEPLKDFSLFTVNVTAPSALHEQFEFVRLDDEQ